MRHRLVGDRWVPWRQEMDVVRPPESSRRGVARTGAMRSITLADNSPYVTCHDKQGRPILRNAQDKRDAILRAADNGERLAME